jgi:hypothetical protein
VAGSVDVHKRGLTTTMALAHTVHLSSRGTRSSVIGHQQARRLAVSVIRVISGHVSGGCLMVQPTPARTEGLRVFVSRPAAYGLVLAFGSLYCPRLEELSEAQAMTLLQDLAVALDLAITAPTPSPGDQ